jgi:CubicO group peptidase (beta-lactamase class C family)
MRKEIALILSAIILFTGCGKTSPVAVLPSPTQKATITSAPPTPTPALQDVAANIDLRLTRLTGNGEFSGSVLFASAEGIFFEKAYGMADRANNIANTTQSKYLIASLGKQFTAMSILILQEQGKLNVQDLFCTYYPGCPDAWQDITIHQLLSHTSGLPTFTRFPEYPTWAEFPKTPDEIIAFFKDAPLAFQPGTSWTYSNSGYVLLGYLIEHLSGLSYGDFLRTNIFTPLGMNNSGYEPDRPSDLAVGYYDKSTEPAFAISPSVPFSSGGIYSTVGDLYLWDQALYTDQLLPQTSLEQAFNPWAVTSDGPGYYGYGWRIGERDGHRMYFHGGLIDGFSAFFMRFPDDRITVILLNNQSDATLYKFSMEFASEILSVVARSSPAR